MSKLVKNQNAVIHLSLMAVMSALVTVGTLIVQIPNGMGGYFNVGDVMIFVTALTFNPLIGGIAGGLGSAIADMIGYPLFVLPTLVIKGFEGLIASLIANKKTVFRDILAVFVAGGEMVTGYFLVELYLYGVAGAIVEIPANIAQIAIGGLIGIPVALVLRRRLPEILKV